MWTAMRQCRLVGGDCDRGVLQGGARRIENDDLVGGNPAGLQSRDDLALLIGNPIFRGIGSGRGLRGGWLIETESDPWCPLTLTTV